MNIPNIELQPNPQRDYLKAESVDRIRTHGRHQGHVCSFTVIRTHDDTLHMVPNATVIAAHHIARPGVDVVPVEVGGVRKVNIDGVTYNIRDDRPLQDPYLEVQ